MKKKKIITIAVVVILSALIISQFSKKNGKEYELARVERGNISQTISETGQVQKGDKINLSFKLGGVIEKIYTAVGKEVVSGSILAKLDVSDLLIQLDEAEASLAVYQADLSKLMAGPEQEEIQQYQTAVANKQIALDTADQGLVEANEDALNYVDSAYLKTYNAKNAIYSIQKSYFSASDQMSFVVRDGKMNIETAASEIEFYYDAARAKLTQDNIDEAVSKTEYELAIVSSALREIREACEDEYYRNIVSSEDKTIVDTHRTYINTAIANITDAKQGVASAKLAISTAQGNLQAAQDDLALLIAPARTEDIISAQNKVNQVQAGVNALRKKIEDSTLKSPVRGQIVEIKKRAGEQVLSGGQDTVFVVLPTVSFGIEADIYEEDIVKMEIGNAVSISLVAFPDQSFSGKVVSIDPAEKMIDGVVYYEVLIGFDEVPENIKSGMSADIVITSLTKENVLLIPERAVLENNGGVSAEVLTDGKVSEKTIEIGLESDDMVEVISGLEEGEEVIMQ
jgi:HlyD family secretion protein